MTDILKQAKHLIECFGPSGDEDKICKLIYSACSEYADEIYTDNLGNLMAHRKSSNSRAKKLMLCAYMDSTGAIITFVEESGRLRFSSLGSLTASGILNTRVVFSSGAYGTILKDEKVSLGALTLNDMYIDISCKNREQALNYVSVGQSCCFVSDTYLRDDALYGFNVSGRMGCFCLIEALKAINTDKFDIYCLFCAQKHLSYRGLFAGSLSVNPDVCIEVDGVAVCEDTQHGSKIIQGKGPAVKIMDKSVISDRKVIDMLTTCAQKHNISLQPEVSHTHSGVSIVQKNSQGALCASIGIPYSSLNASLESINTQDMESVIKTLINL